MPDVASDTLSLERRVDALRKSIEKLNYDYYIRDQPTATMQSTTPCSVSYATSRPNTPS